MKSYAVVGMGSIAKRHLKNLRKLYPQARIYAVSSSGKNSQLPEAADEVISLDELISKKLEYVIIASPAPYHLNTAKQLLSNNIAVLIEKPLAENYISTTEFIHFCEKGHYEEQAAVGYCLRFLPSALIVKKLIEQQALGTIYNVSTTVGQYLPGWRTDKNYKDSVSAQKALGGGALLELSHELDYLMWFFGSLSLQHSWLRTTDELELEVEDIVNLVLVNDEGLHISVHLDFIQKVTQRKCEIIGKKGRVIWDLITNSVTLFDIDGMHNLYSEPEYDKNNMYLDMLETFSSVRMNGFQQLASIKSSSRIIELIELAKDTNFWRKSC